MFFVLQRDLKQQDSDSHDAWPTKQLGDTTGEPLAATPVLLLLILLLLILLLLMLLLLVLLLLVLQRIGLKL